ncbi:hypothetical protein JSE7799_03198 [Jannaschia seosinensis]|uniref:Uncharacterized protein n=1 Tax=Jannaschia seosinensis TaxID=313367 RepID=A0A0M7BGJ5_9RHOB|nr:hypothetical protein [Jannaschia seosinensis]CUH40466.1 hypothetical protein JSE7799_03198 [Jannaschia seosinensis]
MTSRRPASSHLPRSKGAERENARPKGAAILAVGMTPEQAGSVTSRLFGALGAEIVTAPFEDLENVRLSDVIAVVSPVVSAAFDAVDVAQRLALLGFTGHYVAYAPTLPDRELVRQEVREAAPDLAFEIIETGRGPYLAAS